MKRYMIYCCEGTGGLFLSSVFAQTLGYKENATVSKTGHAHNIGHGNWVDTDHTCIIGNYWDNYRPNKIIYYNHVFNDNFRQTDPDVTIVKIHTQPKDYRKVTELYIKKAWPYLWNRNEYNKWASPDYPPYSPDNITESTLVYNDLINDFEKTIIKKWHHANSNFLSDHVIDFRTIMGINSDDLVSVVCDITNTNVNDSVKEYVKNYQTLNQSLYFVGYDS